MTERNSKPISAPVTEPAADLAVASVHRDIFRSVLVGPLKFVVPVAGYFVLYPLMLDRAGIAVLGVWSLLTTLTSYISMADVGFSLLLTREAGRDLTREALVETRRDYVVARRVYAATVLVILAGLAIAGDSPFRMLESYYAPSALAYATALLVLGAALQVTSRLDAAVLSARNDNYGVQMVLAVTPVFPFAASVVGTLLGVPIEGLAVGSLLSGGAQLAIFRWRLKRHHREWTDVQVSVAARETCARVLSLVRRGWHFYAISIGFILREPVFRLILGTALGPPAVGVYDIAMRVTRMIRDVVASGFTSLYPGLAYFHRNARHDEAARLIQVSLLALLAIGAGGLGLLLLFGDIVYALWLGQVPEGVLTATHILVAASVITLANVPFWYLLQASGNERFGAAALWLQTAGVLLLVPLSAILDLTLVGMMVYWVATEFVMLLMICWFAESRLNLFATVVFKPRTLLLVSVAGAFLAAAWIAPMSGTASWPGPGEGFPAWAGKLALAGLYLGVVLPIIWYPLRRFIAVGRAHSSRAGP